MFYEFYENLKVLDQLAKKKRLQIIVKPHPSELKNLVFLKNRFSNLEFSNENISKILSVSKITISFSSTVIEDSLNSGVPVVLFDKWRRYRHCASENNPLKENCAVYYVNNTENLEKCIETLSKSKNINYEKYVKKPSTFKQFYNIQHAIKKLM